MTHCKRFNTMSTIQTKQSYQLVLSRTDKSFRVQLSNREDWISIDRLKPAYVDFTNYNRDILTRSGRTSRPPLRFDMSHPNRGGM